MIALYLRLGALSFGGPFAMIAMMEEEFVEKRHWMTLEKFQQGFAMVKVLPGATATMMALYTAYQRAGRLTGGLCGIAFLLPSATFVLLLSIFYVKVQEMPQISTLFKGMQIGALIVIAESVMRMAKPYVKSTRAIMIASISAITIFIKPGLEPFVILGFGFVGVASVWRQAAAVTILGIPAVAQWPASSTFKIAMICLKTGFVGFGTGLAIIPILETEVVGNHHWLTHSEFLDGLAIGQVTPGPIFTTATFIGYKVSGFPGAFCATAAIFASAFFNILVLLPIIEGYLKDSKKLHEFTSWAFPAVIGGIVATSIRLGMFTVDSRMLLVSLIVFTIVLFKWHPPAWAFIPLSGVAVFVISLFLF